MDTKRCINYYNTAAIYDDMSALKLKHTTSLKPYRVKPIKDHKPPLKIQFD